MAKVGMVTGENTVEVEITKKDNLRSAIIGKKMKGEEAGQLKETFLATTKPETNPLG